MTEHEYVLEMLCCLPKELLTSKLENSDMIPEWLLNIDNESISEALEHYDTEKYAKIREKMLNAL